MLELMHSPQQIYDSQSLIGKRKMTYKQFESLQGRTSVKKRNQREIIIVWGNKLKTQSSEVEEFARYRYHQCIPLHRKNASD